MKTARSSSKTPKGERPALSREARENQLISLAVNQAERQLLEGNAPTTVVVHYLRLASEKERLERQKLEAENKLLQAKTDAIREARNSENMYKEAIEAMRIYSGQD